MGEALPSPYEPLKEVTSPYGTVSPTQCVEVKVVEPNFDTYTVISINPYTLEEQLMLYPVVVVHSSPSGCPYTVIDVE